LIFLAIIRAKGQLTYTGLSEVEQGERGIQVQKHPIVHEWTGDGGQRRWGVQKGIAQAWV